MFPVMFGWICLVFVGDQCLFVAAVVVAGFLVASSVSVQAVLAVGQKMLMAVVWLMVKTVHGCPLKVLVQALGLIVDGVHPYQVCSAVEAESR